TIPATISAIPPKQPDAADDQGAKIKTLKTAMTIDVEDWYHILDSPATPTMDTWASLECRLAQSMDRLLEMFARTGAQATFFWLGWMAERHKQLVRTCLQAGHEVASHGYGHVLAYKVGRRAFQNDILRAKGVIEDITGQAVDGFRAAGFGITPETDWAFDVIRQAGHRYDSSVFPTARAHGGMVNGRLGPHVLHTSNGPLSECPMSVVQMLGHRVSLFGGGYLRLAPKWLIRQGVNQLRATGQPMIVYAHPREIDPDHPRLPLGFRRRFKCYVNLRTTMPKLEWLCQEHSFRTLRELAAETLTSEQTDRMTYPNAA
ncbi:MAG: polysaccharide deacetylase family protein, partial [Phycisphaerae bacterium]|nr:polysaccharide deacetylase family protein [Phycisphaerae bacterium]